MEGSSSKFMDLDEMSLKVLTNCHHEKDNNNSCGVMTSSKLSPTSSCSSDVIGDYIGTESCFDVALSDDNYNDVVYAEPETRVISRRRARREGKDVAAREFPPPIPSLARTENLSSHMPWVLKREYTCDGRLILREEKVRHHEYFRAHRSNGRLTLQLVPLDDDVFHPPLREPHLDYIDDAGDHDYCEPFIGDVSEDADKVNITDDVDNHSDDDNDGIMHNHTFHDNKCNVDDGHGEEAGSGEVGVGKTGEMDGEDEHRIRRVIVSSPKADQTVVESTILSSGGSPVGKCLKSCFLGMQVPEIRPVLS